MFYNAKSGTLELEKGQMNYICFGRGSRVLIMLPGLGESLQSIKGTALPMAVMYREFAKNHRVYLFSRRAPMSPGVTTRDMARDQAKAMEILGIGRADVVGVSMGGMIAQWLAVDHPERVDRLVLTVTAAEPNPVLRESIEEWVALAKAGKSAEFMRSNLRRIYSEDYCRKNGWMAPIVGRFTKFTDRFFVQADACRTHDAAGVLHRIRAKTMVIGGKQDRVVGGGASRQIAAAIPGAVLKMYPQWGHGLYEEERSFNRTVRAFLTADREL